MAKGAKRGAGANGSKPPKPPKLTKAERKAAKAARPPGPGLLDRVTGLVLALFLLSVVVQHTLQSGG